MPHGSLPQGEPERLREQIAELEDENERSSVLLAATAHELLEPLIAVDAYAASLSFRLEGHAYGESRDELDRLRAGASRARLLVETLLRHGALQTAAHGPVDVDRVVRECLQLLESEVRLHEAVVDVAELPVVVGDEPLIRALFANLLRNALKYGRRGGKIAVAASAQSGRWLFSVRSDGATIPPQEREHIFDAYARGRHGPRTPGTGLGLTICRHIVERHGGSIGVTPIPTGGNHFHFTLATGI